MNIRFYKFLVLIALILGSSFSSFSTNKGEYDIVKDDHIIKILAIGNSFSQDAIETYLHELAAAAGIPVIIGNLYIGGASLELHWKNASNDLAAYDYRKIGLDNVKSNRSNTSIADALADENWDYISFQQASPFSGQYSTYEASLPLLFNYVKERASNPNVNYILHQTWAYAQNSTHEGFANYNRDQLTMYNAIQDATRRAKKLVDIDLLIPAGTAIQNGRNTAIGDNFTRDGYHLDLTIGRYTAACTWFEALFGKSVIGNPYKPPGLSAYEADIAQKAAHFAIIKPHEITVRPPVMFHGGAQHTGVYTSESKPEKVQLKWKFKTDGKVFSSPAVYGNIAFVGSEDAKLYAINVETGKELWHFVTGGAISSSPAVFDNTVYFGSDDGFYYALDINSGKEIWKFKTEREGKIGAKGLRGMLPADEYMEEEYDFFKSSPVLGFQNGKLAVFFGSTDGHVYALNATDGRLKWKFKTGGAIRSTPTLYEGKVYVGSWDTYVYALDENTGKEVWKYKTADDPELRVLEGIQASLTAANGKVFLGARDGFLHALDAETGALKWKYDGNRSWILSTASLKGNILYTSTSDSYRFIALDALSGKEIYSMETNGYVFSSAAIAGDNVIFGDFSGMLFIVDAQTGKVEHEFETDSRVRHKQEVLDAKGKLDFVKSAGDRDYRLYETSKYVLEDFYKLGAIVSSPVVVGKTIYFGSADGYLYALE